MSGFGSGLHYCTLGTAVNRTDITDGDTSSPSAEGPALAAIKVQTAVRWQRGYLAHIANGRYESTVVACLPTVALAYDGRWPMVAPGRPGAVSGATRALRCLWPMMRRVAVADATYLRAPCRCRDWHEVRVDERTDR
eukprot:2035780-Prymnesium_polylepis.1